MPGNKSIYSDAVKKASNAAWDHKWDTASAEYRRALAEFPDDVTAHAGLGLALQEANQLEAALHEFRVCSKLQPHDPVLLARTAALLQRLGRSAEAVTSFLALAEMFVSLKQMNKAVEAWRHAVVLEPDRVEVHEKLVSAYKLAGHDGAAAQELTALAKIYQKRGELARAQTFVEQALLLDADNPQAKALLAELTGRGAAREGTDSPVEQARRSSLSRLAQSVFDEGPRWRRSATSAPRVAQATVEGLVAKALNAQTQGHLQEAIDAYKQVLDAGLAGPEVQFNLALLYQQTLHYDDALALFKQTAGEPNFALAAYFAIGQCYRAQGKLDAALENFIQAMKIVDLGTVKREQADEVIRLYESLAESYRAKGAQAHAEQFTQTLVDFLSSKGWEDKVREVRRHIESVAEAGTPVSFAEVIKVPNAEQVIQSLTLSEQYLKKGQLLAAGDEAYRAIELAPDYLPAHVRIAEIFAQAGRTAEAREKYEMLAATAVVRGDTPKALSFYRRAVELAPEDVTQRAKLIDLLTQQGHLPDALAEFLALGASLERAGQAQKAVDKYAEGLRLAQRAGAVSPAVAELRRRAAEGYLKARDWKNALTLFQELRRAAPDDERTCFYLVDLYRRVGELQKSEQELDGLLQRYANAPLKVRAVLATLAKSWQDDLALNLRLARAHVAAGEREQALALLDILGERLLNAGQRDAAIQVIQELIALNPPQIQDYRQLLTQLS